MNTEITSSESKASHLTLPLCPSRTGDQERRGSEFVEPPCVTRFELADLLQVSVRTVDRMIAAGEIPVRRVRGKAVRFLRSDVERYLKGEMRKAECGKCECEPHGRSTSQTTDHGEPTLNHQPTNLN